MDWRLQRFVGLVIYTSEQDNQINCRKIYSKYTSNIYEYIYTLYRERKIQINIRNGMMGTFCVTILWKISCVFASHFSLLIWISRLSRTNTHPLTWVKSLQYTSERWTNEYLRFTTTIISERNESIFSHI